MRDERLQRGLVIAATAKIVQKGHLWYVPPQTSNGRYTVIPDALVPYCICPDHETRACKCKHLFAVEFVMKREENKDGYADRDDYGYHRKEKDLPASAERL